MVIRLPLRDRFLIGGLLILISASAWAVIVQGMPGSVMDPMADSMSSAGGSETPVLFLGTWSLMMAAMMLPSILPMVMTYAGIVRSFGSTINAYARTMAFVLGYLALWSAVGMLFYAVNIIAPALQSSFPTLGIASPVSTGALLILAGSYQLTPFKERCLTGCRTPLGFVASQWREGFGGGFLMGLGHGLYCLGCCGAMLAVLAAFGLMNLTVMVLLALWIFAEKLLPFGSPLAKLSAAGFMASGILFILFPSLLPIV